jgi:hypothetical protein
VARVAQLAGEAGGQAGQDHPGGRAGVDLPLGGDQRGQAGGGPPGEAGQVQDQAQARGGADQGADGAGEPSSAALRTRP